MESHLFIILSDLSLSLTLVCSSEKIGFQINLTRGEPQNITTIIRRALDTFIHQYPLRFVLRAWSLFRSMLSREWREACELALTLFGFKTCTRESLSWRSAYVVAFFITSCVCVSGKMYCETLFVTSF